MWHNEVQYEHEKLEDPSQCATLDLGRNLQSYLEGRAAWQGFKVEMCWVMLGQFGNDRPSVGSV